MFNGCANLTCTAPDTMFKFGTTGPSFMFASCTNLTSLDVTRWDLSGLANIGFSFSACTNLSDIDPSGWDVSNITNMKALFKNCQNVDKFLTVVCHILRKFCYMFLRNSKFCQVLFPGSCRHNPMIGLKNQLFDLR